MPNTVDFAVIERASVTTPLPGVVEYLQEHLGSAVVAYLAGLGDTQMLRRWKDGTSPQTMAKQRLRSAYHATRMLVEAFDDETAEAWFFGSNSKLDDEAPVRVLRTAQSVDDLGLVVPAAKAFTRAPE
jgi:hypothetical protein